MTTRKIEVSDPTIGVLSSVELLLLYNSPFLVLVLNFLSCFLLLGVGWGSASWGFASSSKLTRIQGHIIYTKKLTI